MPRVIAIDVKKCLGCHSCEVACALAHSAAKTLGEAIQEQPLAQPRILLVAVGEASVPVQCRHCEDAPCVEICPKEALQQPDPEGPVIFDPELCTACQLCIIACPFGVISLSFDGKSIIRCDQCAERVEQGMQPACVDACPTGAIQFVSIDELPAEALPRSASETVALLEQEDVEAAQG